MSKDKEELVYEKDEVVLEEVTESFDNKETTKIDEAFIYEDNPYRKQKYWLSEYARGRVTSNQNFILIFTGGTGSGKSYSAMEVALDLDPNFTVDRIVFKPEDFISVLKGKMPKGSVIMWDEVGVGLSAREWYSIQNKMISYVLETFRRDNLILIMTTPNISFIDKKVRALLHGYAETVEKTFTGGRFGYVKYFHILVSLREGKMMYRYPRIKDASGRTRIVKGATPMAGNMRFAKPPDSLTKPYEEKKYEFTEALKDEAFEIMTGTGEDTSKLSIKNLIDIMVDDPKKFGLLDEDAVTNIVNTAYVEFRLGYPDKKFSKADIDASIKYIIKKGINKEVSKSKKEVLDDSMLNTVKKAHDKEGDYRLVAKTIDVDKGVLKRTIAKWKKRKMWNDA